MELIRPFGRIGKDDAGIAGGKGASLGEMTQAGIPVPPGFVILAGAFERFLAEADLNQELDTIFHTVNHQEIRTVDLASEKIRQLIVSAKMPEDIAEEIRSNFEKLGATHVAVRSSATAEDSQSAAWAGQLETYLNTTESDLLANVQKCWASLFTPRAIFYRFEKGMHGQQISVAVVVQKMVQSEVSGIAFSVHPVTEDYNQIIIEAGFGLGEAIVSGQVTPDSYVIEKSPRRIIDKNVTYQNRALWRGKEGGNEWRELSEEEGSKPALQDEQALELAELVLKIEEHYGFPCDIEWAFEDGEFFITQSRPITTLSPKVTSEREYYKNLNFKIMGRYATYPADTELWHTEHTSRYFEERFGAWKEALAVHVFDKEFYMYICTPRSFQKKLHARIRELTAVDPKAMEKIFLRFYEEKAAAKRDIPKINPPNLSQITNGELADVYMRNRDAAHRIVIYDQFTWLAEDYWPPLMDEVLVGKLGLVKGSPEYNDTLFALIKPREISTTLEEKREVIEETLRIRAGTQTIEKASAKLAGDFGWMPVLTFGVPWDADHYRKELEALGTESEGSLEREVSELKNYTHLRDKGIERIVQKYSISPEDLQIFIDFGLGIDTRNEAEYVASIAGSHLLPLYDEIARRLGLSIIELRTLCESEIVSSLVGKTDAHALLAGKGHVVAWGLDGTTKTRVNFSPSEGEDVLAHLASGDAADSSPHTGTARGITAGRGKARGKVRLVPSPDDNHRVEQGDILFAYSTMVDNLPAMKKAGAIVTESGGLTCHAAVVSREFGIPCIVGLKGAMAMFEDGDMVEVDAEKGIVRKL